MGFSAPASALIDFGLEGWGGDSLMEFCQSHHIYITSPIRYLRRLTIAIFGNIYPESSNRTPTHSSNEEEMRLETSWKDFIFGKEILLNTDSPLASEIT